MHTHITNSTLLRAVIGSVKSSLQSVTCRNKHLCVYSLKYRFDEPCVPRDEQQLCAGNRRENLCPSALCVFRSISYMNKMNYYGSANKYVCPNDRQLSLRAKLRTGWSAARSEPPLTPGERAAIADVVKRADKLDELEAKRIGRLVSRLDGMRRAARGPVSGSCLLCGERGRLLAPLRSCTLCRNYACPKCVIDNPPHRDQYLCNICAETKEMWKKSGAWFFKAMPRFILPERKGANRYSDTRLAASLQEAASTSAEQARTDSSECGSPLVYTANRSFSRQITENHKPNSIQESNAMDWVDMELRHAVSGLSLNRSESFGQKSLLKRTGSKGSAYSIRSYRKDSQKMPTTPPADKTPSVPLDAGCGALEIRLLYDSSSSMLACTVLRARGLPGMDMHGLSDPFCRLEILPKEGTCSNRLRTKTVHKTKNPEFNETLNFYGITETDLNSKSLDIRVYDDDRYGCDAMGATSVALRDCQLSSQVLRLALTTAAEDDDGIPNPQILLSLGYNTKKRALAVTICRCTNLPPMDSNGYSDPFIKLHLDPDPAHKKHKTSIKWRNLNPVYNEEFFFETRPTELSRQSLTLTVWDKDYGKPDDFLGSLVIGSTSKGKRLKHWLDCIKFPDHRHEQWHALTDTQHL